jgi:hypothetical protein
MDERRCDLCGRTEGEILAQTPGTVQALELNGMGLWLCLQCRSQPSTGPSSLDEDREVYEFPAELRPLLNKSAGAICMTMDLPRRPPFREIVEDAYVLQGRTMGAWIFVTQWNDGSTIWRSPDGLQVAIIKFDGTMRIEQR